MMDKEVIWHPDIYRRFMGPMQFFFISSFFFKNFRERVDALIEGWGVSKFSRDLLIGEADILIRAHYTERQEQVPLRIRLHEAMGGAGVLRTFVIDRAYRFYGYQVPDLKPGALELFTGDELASFQQNPSNEPLEKKLRAENIMLGWKKADKISESATCVEFLTPNIGLIQDTVGWILEGARVDDETGRYLTGLYSGAGFGSILLEWSTADREMLLNLVAKKLHERLALSASRTDTFIVATHSRSCFHYCQFAPESLLDIAKRLVSIFPGFESLALEEQLELSRLWHDCRMWESRPDQLVRRLISARAQGSLSGQRYVIQELGDRLESILARHIQGKAEELWGEQWREELAKKPVPEKSKPFERWTLGSLADAAAIISKEARDRDKEGLITQTEAELLRGFPIIRNNCVHASDLTEQELQNLPSEIADGFRRILPLFYRLEEAL